MCSFLLKDKADIISFAKTSSNRIQLLFELDFSLQVLEEHEKLDEKIASELAVVQLQLEKLQ